MAQEVLLIKNTGDSVRTKIKGLSKDIAYTGAGNIKVADVLRLILANEQDKAGTLGSIFEGRIEINPDILLIDSYEREPTLPNFNDWVIDNSEALWKHVYKLDGDSLVLAKRMMEMIQSLTFVDATGSDKDIIGKIQNWSIDYRKYGGSAMGTTMMFSRGKWSGSFKIEFKKDRYRVVVSTLGVDAGSVSVNSYGSIGVGVSQNMSWPWSSIILTKDHQAFRSGQMNNALFMSKVLKDLFEVKPEKKTKDDW